jgi:hypothetical protein
LKWVPLPDCQIAVRLFNQETFNIAQVVDMRVDDAQQWQYNQC